MKKENWEKYVHRNNCAILAVISISENYLSGTISAKDAKEHFQYFLQSSESPNVKNYELLSVNVKSIKKQKIKFCDWFLRLVDKIFS